jgi:hypothetical protein
MISLQKKPNFFLFNVAGSFFYLKSSQQRRRWGYHRYKDLESLAYNLRHSESKYKTRVKMGTSDLVLYKRKPSENYWTVVFIQPFSQSTAQVQLSRLNLQVMFSSIFGQTQVLLPSNPIRSNCPSTSSITQSPCKIYNGSLH